MRDKLVAVGHLAKSLAPAGVLFGSTLLSGGVRRGWPARRLMDFYNRKQIFSNAQDDLQTLERGLTEIFSSYDIEVVGCAALLRGHVAA